ncbi:MULTISPECIES: heavy-metal-associated domain-containing protein [Spirosoma]|uniref:Heavy metal transport/detoxification protein n=1 Tax=Spirosoma sordidisoli TaxID=2502893 RepID=A0A4Q2UHB3_9BACT|nr:MULTISPECIES: heavy metal transport/detoxification protein [Spirosoma]RYC66845.1 heavy metal transport/detoxification protein [Spirosoma sordidisoli]
MDAKQFKTNIKCANCVAAVTPFLNEAVGENAWQVDLQSPNRVLTVDTATSDAAVTQAIEKAGYKAEPLS